MLVIYLSSFIFNISSASNFYPNTLYISEKVESGNLADAINESSPYSLCSFPSVIMVLVFLFEAVFSTIENGFPGYTRVALMNDDPKSIPNIFAYATESVAKMAYSSLTINF